MPTAVEYKLCYKSDPDTIKTLIYNQHDKHVTFESKCDKTATYMFLRRELKFSDTNQQNEFDDDLINMDAHKALALVKVREPIIDGEMLFDSRIHADMVNPVKHGEKLDLWNHPVRIFLSEYIYTQEKIVKYNNSF